MQVFLFILLIVVFANCTIHQVQVHNRSPYTLTRTLMSTAGRFESHPARTLYPLMWTTMAISGDQISFNSLRYTGNRQSGYIRFGIDGCTCEGCDCRVETVSSTSWKVYFSC
ncbi:hypothetical protein GEMRC1_006437 [Eukaryota sp. GEM-RC1]